MNINGLRAGYTGPGTTLWTLPASAQCTIDHRLPPDLDPERCTEKIREHLDRHGYDDIHLEVLMSVGAQSIDLHDDLAQAAVQSYRLGVSIRCCGRGGGRAVPAATSARCWG